MDSIFTVYTIILHFPPQLVRTLLHPQPDLCTPPPQLSPRPNDSLWLNAVETTPSNTSNKADTRRTKEDAHLHHHEGGGETNTSHLDEKAQYREQQQAWLWFYRSQDGAPGPWRSGFICTRVEDYTAVL